MCVCVCEREREREREGRNLREVRELLEVGGAASCFRIQGSGLRVEG